MTITQALCKENVRNLSKIGPLQQFLIKSTNIRLKSNLIKMVHILVLRLGVFERKFRPPLVANQDLRTGQRNENNLIFTHNI